MVVTIGESPRVDLIPYVQHLFPVNVKVEERGLLDDFTEIDFECIKPEKGHTILVSKLKNGESVEMSKEKITPHLQKIVDELNQQEIDLIILACTGSFELFSSKILVIYPDYLISKVINGLIRKEPKLNIIVPKQNQIESNQRKWNSEGIITYSEFCSPYNYSEQKLVEAVRKLNNNEGEIILLDCIGYTKQMKKVAKNVSNKKIVLSREILFQNVARLF